MAARTNGAGGFDGVAGVHCGSDTYETSKNVGFENDAHSSESDRRNRGTLRKIAGYEGDRTIGQAPSQEPAAKVCSLGPAWIASRTRICCVVG